MRTGCCWLNRSESRHEATGRLGLKATNNVFTEGAPFVRPFIDEIGISIGGSSGAKACLLTAHRTDEVGLLADCKANLHNHRAHAVPRFGVGRKPTDEAVGRRAALPRGPTRLFPGETSICHRSREPASRQATTPLVSTRLPCREISTAFSWYRIQ